MPPLAGSRRDSMRAMDGRLVRVADEAAGMRRVRPAWGPGRAGNRGSPTSLPLPRAAR